MEEEICYIIVADVVLFFSLFVSDGEIDTSFLLLRSSFSPLIRGTKWREKIESFFHFFSQRLIELMKVGSMDENHFRNFVNAKFFSNRLILGERGKKR